MIDDELQESVKRIRAALAGFPDLADSLLRFSGRQLNRCGRPGPAAAQRKPFTGLQRQPCVGRGAVLHFGGRRGRQRRVLGDPDAIAAEEGTRGDQRSRRRAEQ